MKWSQISPVDFTNYSEWAKDHDHVVQVSFQRSGRVWISSMVIFLCGDDVNLRMPLDNKFYQSEVMTEKLYYTTHLYESFPFSDRAKYVLLVRDPRSALLSRMIWVERHIDANYNASSIMNEWIEEWKYYIDILVPLNTLVIQYEKMCLYPQQQLDRIIEFAGFDAINGLDYLRRLSVLSDERDFDRYLKYCFKWKHHKKMVECYNDRIWRELCGVMEEYRYYNGGYAEI